MYELNSRVRYSETDEEGNLSVVGIMNYLQDCSTFQSEDLKLGISYLNEEKRAWWLSGWQIEILRQPHFGERIRISTWPYGFKGIYGYRNFTIEDEMGNPLVRADSTWFYYDLEKGCPVRVPESQLEGYQIEVLGDVMYPKLAQVPEGYVVSLQDAEGQVYANLWLAKTGL